MGLVKRARLVEDDVQGVSGSEKRFNIPEKSQIFSQEGTEWSFHLEKITESCFWRQMGERMKGQLKGRYWVAV